MVNKQAQNVADLERHILELQRCTALGEESGESQAAASQVVKAARQLSRLNARQRRALGRAVNVIIRTAPSDQTAISALRVLVKRLRWYQKGAWHYSGLLDGAERYAAALHSASVTIGRAHPYEREWEVLRGYRTGP